MRHVSSTSKTTDPNNHLLRNQIVAEYLPYVSRIVNRLAGNLPAVIDVEDLIHVGVIGLMQAIERFDPTRDNKFLTYAIFRIRGAVLSEIRSKDYFGRTIRNKIRGLEKAYLKLEQQMEREPTEEEVANEMQLNMEQFYQIKKLTGISFISFDEIGYTNRNRQDSLMHSLVERKHEDALSMASIKEIRENLAEGIDELPEKQKNVVSMYYGDELTMKEIGEVLGITESRVSQIHTQAIFRLRSSLRREGLLGDGDISN